MTLSARTVGLSLTTVAIIGGLVYVVFRTDPVPVDLAEIRRGSIQVTIDADGKTQIRDIYEVAAPISGLALRAPVEVGQEVIKNDTVVAIVEPVAPSLLDTRSRIQAEAAIREAEAALHVAQTDLQKALEDQTYAQSQFDRVKALVDRGVSSMTQLESVAQQLAIANAAVEAARARIEMGQGTLQRAQAALIEPSGATDQEGTCCVRMMAPADGVVLSIEAISERPVAAGTPLLSIGDPMHLEIVADLLSSDAVRIRDGADALVERWGGGTTLKARLDRIEPSARTKVSALGIEEQRVDAIFELVSPPEETAGLGDGFSVFLRIIEWQAEDVVLIPLSAVFRRGENWAVFVVDDGYAIEREIVLGRRNARHAVVESGLEPGERVITHPSEDIADGTSIVSRADL